MKVLTISIVLLSFLCSCCAISVSENGTPSEKLTAIEERSKTQKRESVDQSASEDKKRSTVNDQKFDNQQNVKQQTNYVQYQTPFVPTNGQYYASPTTSQIQYAKPEINQIEYNKLEAPSSTVQYTQHYRSLPTYQTLSYSGYHPSHEKLATFQYVTSPVSSSNQLQYTNDFAGHSSVPSIQYAAAPLSVPSVAAPKVNSNLAYSSNAGSYINYQQPSPAQVQLAYAVHIPQQVQQFFKQAAPGIQYAALPQQASVAAPQHAGFISQAAPASTNQHYYIAASNSPAVQQSSNFVYAQKPHQAQSHQLYYAMVPHYNQGGYTFQFQPQHQQPQIYQFQANKQQVLATNSINGQVPVASVGHVQIAASPAVLYKQQQHYIPAVVTSPAPFLAGAHNPQASSFSTFSAQYSTPAPTAAGAIAQQYKALAPVVTIQSTTSKTPTIYATTTTAAPSGSGVIYHQQPNQQVQQQQLVQHHLQPRYIFASAQPAYTSNPNSGNIHYGSHLYHPLLTRSIVSATPPPSFGK